MSGTTVWTFDEFAVGASTSEPRNWLPVLRLLTEARTRVVDQSVWEVVHDDWSGVRQTSQNF